MHDATLIIRLPHELLQRLDDEKTRTDVPTAAFVRKAILDRLNRTVVDAEPPVQKME